jgi:hypothetical protein
MNDQSFGASCFTSSISADLIPGSGIDLRMRIRIYRSKLASQANRNQYTGTLQEFDKLTIDNFNLLRTGLWIRIDSIRIQHFSSILIRIQQIFESESNADPDPQMKI